MVLPIPQDELPNMTALAKLPEKSFKELVEALKIIPPLSDIDQIMKLISSKVSIPEKQLGHLLNVLGHLYRIKEFVHKVSLNEFVDDVIEGTVEGLIQRDDKNLKIGKEQFLSLEKKLKILLNISPLKIAAKATVLQRDGERLFCHAKILSDIRPVFDDNLTKAPAGAVITHSLKLAYHANKGEHQEIYVLLDSDDLKSLKRTIDRAEEKSQTLKSFMKQIKVSDLSE